ncbi:MAG: cell division protein ZapA [Bacteroidetes bacterium]|nr:cell division protein ZapA [Bacteroidota bacterium]
MSGELTITIKIGEKPYRLTIERGQEMVFRQAAQQLEQRMVNYRDVYAYKDKQDLLAMVALEYAAQVILMNGQTEEKQGELTGQLQELEQMITMDA